MEKVMQITLPSRIVCPAPSPTIIAASPRLFCVQTEFVFTMHLLFSVSLRWGIIGLVFFLIKWKDITVLRIEARITSLKPEWQGGCWVNFVSEESQHCLGLRIHCHIVLHYFSDLPFTTCNWSVSPFTCINASYPTRMSTHRIDGREGSYTNLLF